MLAAHDEALRLPPEDRPLQVAGRYSAQGQTKRRTLLQESRPTTRGFDAPHSRIESAAAGEGKRAARPRLPPER